MKEHEKALQHLREIKDGASALHTKTLAMQAEHCIEEAELESNSRAAASLIAGIVVGAIAGALLAFIAML